MAARYPIVVIVGPTASGKTSLAVEIAARYNGEVISADSRAVYTGLDIGTAKPDADERHGVVHWGFDLVEPSQRFTVYDFKQYADEKIRDIQSRGKLVVMAGGTGLYVSSVIYDYSSMQHVDGELKKKLEDCSTEELHEYCNSNNIRLPYNSYNKRHIIASIIHKGIDQKSNSKPLDSTIVVGIATDRKVLRERIRVRAKGIFTSKVIEEARHAASLYGWDCEAMTGNIYPLIRSVENGELSTDEAKLRFETLDWQLAKRQMTWFRRDPYIAWVSRDECREYISASLDRLSSYPSVYMLG